MSQPDGVSQLGRGRLAGPEQEHLAKRRTAVGGDGQLNAQALFAEAMGTVEVPPGCIAIEWRLQRRPDIDRLLVEEHYHRIHVAGCPFSQDQAVTGDHYICWNDQGVHPFTVW